MILPPALRHHKFVLLWAGLFISIAGSQMQYWTLLWHIRELTDQPIAVSGIGLARFIPILAFALIGGLFADRYDRRKIMLITQATMALVALALGLLTISGQIRLGWIYLLTAVQAVAISFDLPARQSLIPNLVPREDLTSAFSMNSIAADLGAIIGPALSGLAIAAMGLSSVYLFNAVSFMAVIVALLMIGAIPQQSVKHAAANNIHERIDAGLFDIRAGWRFILHQPIIMGSMILDFFATFFSSANTLLPVFAKDVLHGDERTQGWLLSAAGAGAMIGALFVASQRSPARLHRLMTLGGLVFGLGLVAFSWSPNLGRWIAGLLGDSSAGRWLAHATGGADGADPWRAPALCAAVALLVFAGVGRMIMMASTNTYVQTLVDDDKRSRVMAFHSLAFMGMAPMGALMMGKIAQTRLDATGAILLSGVACVAGAILFGGRVPMASRREGRGQGDAEEPGRMVGTLGERRP